MIRGVRLDAVRALLERCLGERGNDAERALIDAVLGCLSHDRHRYTDVLECSLSQDARGLHPFRFSYAFPGWRTDPAGSEQGMLACAAPFGEQIVAIFRRLLATSRHPAVEQVLFGYAGASAGAEARVKCYVQFPDGSDTEARAFAQRLLGRKLECESEKALHLIGLDYGLSGRLAGVKCYYLCPSLTGPETASLLSGWARPLRQPLFIHRIPGEDTVSAPAPAQAEEIDFALKDSGLRWDDLQVSPPMSPFSDAVRFIAELGTRYRIRVRRISFSLNAAHKTNVYYALDDQDEGYKPASDPRRRGNRADGRLD